MVYRCLIVLGFSDGYAESSVYLSKGAFSSVRDDGGTSANEDAR